MVVSSLSHQNEEASEARPTSMTDLPVELKDQIISYLAPLELTSIGSTNKYFSELTERHRNRCSSVLSHDDLLAAENWSLYDG